MHLYKNPRPQLTDIDDEEIIITKPSRGLSQVQGNEIYFYSDVSLGSVFSLNKALSDLEKQMLITQIQLGMPKPPHIKLFINSDGGEIFSAFTTVDRIVSSKVPIHTYVEGIAASAATLISVCGSKRYIGKSGVMLVHQLRSWCGGTHENLKDEAKNLDMLAEQVTQIYLEHTKFSKADLEEILKHDMYLNANECVKYGLVDFIL